jgi:hypothetical protein
MTMTDEERAEMARLRAENAELRAKLDKANDPTWPLKEREVRALEQIADRPKQKNVLETISHWWCPDKSRHMRMNY